MEAETRGIPVVEILGEEIPAAELLVEVPEAVVLVEAQAAVNLLVLTQICQKRSSQLLRTGTKS